MKAGALAEVRGADRVARFYLGKAQLARPVLVDGDIGVVVAPRGQLQLMLRLSFAHGRIAGIDVVADRQSLAAAEIMVLEN
jgi:RNA polymerase sigma-70 factor (ECF subfamily)